MADLIDRQAAINVITEYADRLQMVNWQENPGVPYKAYTLNWCVNTIRDLPSVDAVEVVYCKDCIRHNNDTGDVIWIGLACPLVKFRGKAQGHEFDYQYCVYGRRKDE